METKKECKSCAILRRYEKTARERGYAMGKVAGNNELAQVQELLAAERKAHAETNTALTAEITRLEAQLAAVAPGDDDAKDAARWRAMLGSARIRMLGSAGLNAPEPNQYAHLSMEIWTTYGLPGEFNFSKDNAQGKEWLTKYADIAIAAQSNAAPVPAAPPFDPETCQHKNSYMMYERDEYERHACRDCGRIFTVEIPE